MFSQMFVKKRYYLCCDTLLTGSTLAMALKKAPHILLGSLMS
ncbi:MAG: hypothetical protein ACFWT9_07035 [Lactiplantibacillus plantarum]